MFALLKVGTSQVGPSPNTKKLVLQLSACDDELSSTTKITTFLVKPLSKLPNPVLSNVIPYPLYRYFSLSLLSLFFTILVASNKQFLNLKF